MLAVKYLDALRGEAVTDAVRDRFPFLKSETDTSFVLQRFADWMLFELPNTAAAEQ